MKKNFITSCLIVLPVLAAAWQPVCAADAPPKAKPGQEKAGPEKAVHEEPGHDQPSQHEQTWHDQEDSLSDSRMKVLYYDPNDVYTILTRVGYESYIELSKQEEIDTISVGDRTLWQLIPSGSRLFIRPLRNDVSTNMTLITNKRTYQFDLKSTADEKQKIVYVARFMYPEDERFKMRNVQQTAIANPFMPNPALQMRHEMPAQGTVPPQPPIMIAPTKPLPPQPAEHESKAEQPKMEQQAIREPEPQHPAAMPSTEPETFEQPPIQMQPATQPRLAPIPAQDKRNYHYTMSGPEAVSPYEVFDDGSSTYFRFDPPALLPPQVGILKNNGTEIAATVYQNGPYFAVDVVAPKLLMHTPTGTAYVFNETLSKNP